MQELAGKVAVVTGAGSGIGRAIALTLAGEGQRVAVVDIDRAAALEVAAEILTAGGEALGLACDVSVRAEVRAVADEVFIRFGAVHVLCNNAGVTSFTPVTEMTDDAWDWIIGVDLMSVVYGYQAFLPRMLAQGGDGHIVNSSSGIGVVPGMLPNHTAYATAKGGIVALSASLRTELAGTGFGVSVLCPAMVRTQILSSLRVRPQRYGGPQDSVETVPGMADPLAGAMDPMVVGRAVVEAIRTDRAFIFPEPGLREHVVRFYEEMLADFPPRRV